MTTTRDIMGAIRQAPKAAAPKPGPVLGDRMQSGEGGAFRCRATGARYRKGDGSGRAGHSGGGGVGGDSGDICGDHSPAYRPGCGRWRAADGWRVGSVMACDQSGVAVGGIPGMASGDAGTGRCTAAGDMGKAMTMPAALWLLRLRSSRSRLRRDRSRHSAGHRRGRAFRAAKDWQARIVDAATPAQRGLRWCCCGRLVAGLRRSAREWT